MKARSAEVRDELIRALRLDLIGPEPGNEHEREEHERRRFYVVPQDFRVHPRGEHDEHRGEDQRGEVLVQLDDRLDRHPCRRRTP